MPEASGTPRVKIVIGANLGDEGKGLMTDHFCAAHPGALVVLTNGGAQRGHTVELENGARRVFRHLGSGTLRGAGSHFSGRYILNPMQFCRELAENLRAAALPLSRDADCLWSTPFDMIANQIQTLRQGRTNSCGMGIWETLERYRRFREAGRATPTLAEFNALPEAARLDWLQDLRRYHEERLRGLGMSLSDCGFAQIVDAPGLLARFLADCRTMVERVPARPADTTGVPAVIYENAQGLLLDQDIPDAAEVNTPSRTGLGDVFAEVESAYRGADVEVCYVSRTYLTRHGEGRLEGECEAADIGRVLCDRTNPSNPFQGPLRHARLDKRALVERVQADFRACVDGGPQPPRNRYRLSLCLTHMNECGLDYRDIGDEVDRLYVSFGRTARDVRLVKDGGARR